MTLIFRLIIRRDIWIFHSEVFSSDQLKLINYIVKFQTTSKTNYFITKTNILYTIRLLKCNFPIPQLPRSNSTITKNTFLNNNKGFGISI